MQDEVANVVEFPYCCTVKVHRLICLELKKCIDRISQIFSAIESARPGCASGIPTLCSLHHAMERAMLVIRHCSDCSKLYLAITGDGIVSRCEKVRKDLESCLTQIHNMVPLLLATQISRIVDDLKAVTFTVESCEDEAGKVLVALFQQDIVASESTNMSELKALQLAALRLNITSPVAILIEKRSIKKLLEKIHDTNLTKKKILKYLLYLLRKYGKTLIQNERPLNQSIEPELQADNARKEDEADLFDIAEPPEEFLCPLSKRLMYDPVIIASGQTFEKVWIEKWFNEGLTTCPKTQMKLLDLSLTPNFAIKDLILRWCVKHGITIPDPCSHPTSAPLRLRKCSSSSSIVSLGSSLNELQLQTSNISIRSSDTNFGLGSLDSNDGDKFISHLPRMNANSQRVQPSANSHGTYLAFLSNLGALSPESRCKAVDDVKNQLKDNNPGSHSVFSNCVIEPLILFLKDAQDLHNSGALRDGAQLLLTFLSERSETPPLQKNAIYILSSLLNSDITKEALDIIEVFSGQRYYKSEIVASGVLPSILRILENPNSEFHLLAVKILCNLSADSDVGHHIVYLDYIPKLAPFLGDRALAGYCIEIFRNMCSTEELRAAVAESKVCIASIAKLLETGTKGEQELAMDVLLSLGYQCAEYCQLITEESIIPSLVSISANGNARGRLLAKELIQLLRDFKDARAQEGAITKVGLNIDIPQADHPKENKSSKASRILGRKMAIFSKRR